MQRWERRRTKGREEKEKEDKRKTKDSIPGESNIKMLNGMEKYS